MLNHLSYTLQILITIQRNKYNKGTNWNEKEQLEVAPTPKARLKQWRSPTTESSAKVTPDPLKKYQTPLMGVLSKFIITRIATDDIVWKFIYHVLVFYIILLIK